MKKLFLSLLVLAALALASCASLGGGAGTATCPEPGEGMEQYTSEVGAYCVNFPEAYTAVEFEEGSSVRIEEEPPAMPHPLPPFATVDVIGETGQSAEAAADAVEADLQAALPDWQVVRETTMLGGESAVVLRSIPGQDINRQVFAVHAGQLYRLTFYPDDPNVPEFSEMELLYNAVLESFTFTGAE